MRRGTSRRESLAMQSRSGSEAGRRLLVAVGTAHFENLVDSDLRLVPDELERIATAFIALGYERLQGVADPDRDQLRKLFAKVGEDCSAEDVVVAYSTAHGARIQSASICSRASQTRLIWTKRP